MIPRLFNNLANSHHAATDDELGLIMTPDTSLVVYRMPIPPAARQYVDNLDFNELGKNPEVTSYHRDPARDFFFRWMGDPNWQPEKYSAMHTPTHEYLHKHLPHNAGHAEFIDDVAKRVSLFREATGSTDTRTELRFSYNEDTSEYFHTDSGYLYRGGTAYLQDATLFVDEKILAEHEREAPMVAPTKPGIAPHVVKPALEDFYLFKASRPHCIPPTNTRRVTLIIGNRM